MNAIQFIQISPDQLREELQKGLDQKLQELSEQIQKLTKEDRLFTSKEAADYLSIDLSTLWAWRKKGYVKAYGIGNRVYYKKSEIEQALIQINAIPE